MIWKESLWEKSTQKVKEDMVDEGEVKDSQAEEVLANGQ